MRIKYIKDIAQKLAHDQHFIKTSYFLLSLYAEAGMKGSGLFPALSALSLTPNLGTREAMPMEVLVTVLVRDQLLGTGTWRVLPGLLISLTT